MRLVYLKLLGLGFKNSAISGKLLEEGNVVMWVVLYSAPLDLLPTCEGQIIQFKFQRVFCCDPSVCCSHRPVE